VPEIEQFIEHARAMRRGNPRSMCLRHSDALLSAALVLLRRIEVCLPWAGYGRSLRYRWGRDPKLQRLTRQFNPYGVRSAASPQ